MISDHESLKPVISYSCQCFALYALRCTYRLPLNRGVQDNANLMFRIALALALHRHDSARSKFRIHVSGLISTTLPKNLNQSTAGHGVVLVPPTPDDISMVHR